jgi:hypothetical protein
MVAGVLELLVGRESQSLDELVEVCTSRNVFETVTGWAAEPRSRAVWLEATGSIEPHHSLGRGRVGVDMRDGLVDAKQETERQGHALCALSEALSTMARKPASAATSHEVGCFCHGAPTCLLLGGAETSSTGNGLLELRDQPLQEPHARGTRLGSGYVVPLEPERNAQIIRFHSALAKAEQLFELRPCR